MTSYDLAKREADRLTPRGWPRPWSSDRHGDRRPVPWITRLPDFAKMEPSRGGQMLRYTLCQVCGEDHGDGDAIIFLDGGLRDRETLREVTFPTSQDAIPPLADFTLRAHDGAMLHERCALLTVKHCPFVKRAHEKDRLFGFIGPASAIFTRTKHGVPSEVFMPGDKARVWLMPEQRS